MNLYKECTAKIYSFFVKDTNLVSDNSFSFSHNLLERMRKLIKTIDDKIRDKKL